jgi:hypothetical protein
VNAIKRICKDDYICLWCDDCFERYHDGRRKTHKAVSITKAKARTGCLGKIYEKLRNKKIDFHAMLGEADGSGGGLVGSEEIQKVLKGIECLTPQEKEVLKGWLYSNMNLDFQLEYKNLAGDAMASRN